jgi:hypothetical protein
VHDIEVVENLVVCFFPQSTGFWVSLVKSYPNQIKDGAKSILEITGGSEYDGAEDQTANGCGETDGTGVGSKTSTLEPTMRDNSFRNHSTEAPVS